MKRDMDLIRLILLKIENSEDEEIENLTIKGYSTKEILYNAKLLEQNNMIEYCKEDIIGNYYIGSMTWDGSDYLDKVRDDSKWKKIKDVIKEKALPFTFDIVKNVASTFITSAVEGAVTAYLKNGGQP